MAQMAETNSIWSRPPLPSASYMFHHSNCTETFENSDPVSTLLAAYAISCKLDPKDFNYRADSMCERNLWLGMPPGMSNFVGMPEAEFEARFASYPAPVPVAFATQVAAFAQG